MGQVKDSSGNYLEGARFQIIDSFISSESSIRGHVTSGVTKTAQRQIDVRNAFDHDSRRYMPRIRRANSHFYIVHNMALQFYMPQTSLIYRRGRYIDVAVRSNPVIRILIEKEGYLPVVKEVSLKHRFTHNHFGYPARSHKFNNAIEVVLYSEAESADNIAGTNTSISGEDWPSHLIPNIPALRSLNFTPVTSGSLGNCPRPSRISSGRLIDGYKWQDFIYCRLGTSNNVGELGLNYKGLYGYKSALDFMVLFWEHYIKSDEALGLSNENKLAKIYEALTFKSLGSSQRSGLRTAVARYGLEPTLLSMLDGWYNSSAYASYFNYSLKRHPAKKLFRFAGRVQDHRGNALSSVGVTIQTSNRLNQLGTATTNGAGVFSQILAVEEDFYEADVVVRTNAANYSTGSRFLSLRDEEIIHEGLFFQLTRLGMATPGLGGEICSNNKDVSIYIPPNAVSAEVSFRVGSPVPANITESKVIIDAQGNIKTVETTEQVFEFEVTPNYEFQTPVALSVTLSDTMKSALGINSQESTNIIAMFSKNEVGELVLIEQSNYDPDSGTLTALTDHFSIFVIASCSRKNRCMPGVEPAQGGSIFERSRLIKFPRDLPGLKNEAVQRLTSGGWDASSVRDINLPEDLNLPEDFELSCNDSVCNEEIVKNFTQRELGIPKNFSQTFSAPAGFLRDLANFFGVHTQFTSSVGSIDVFLAQLSFSAVMEAQIEQCAQNPLASIPQVRINSVQSLDADFVLNIRLNNVRLEYPEFRVLKRFLGIPISISTKGVDRFSHTIQVRISNIKQLFQRNTSGSPNWRLGPSVNGRKIISFALDTHASYKRLYKQKILEILENKTPRYLARELGEQALDLLRTVNDPVFDEENCTTPATTYTVGGNVSGLHPGDRIVLQNNGINDVKITGNGSFRFPLAVASGADYSVNISEILINSDRIQGCVIRNEKGRVGSGNVSHIQVICNPQLYPVRGNINGLVYDGRSYSASLHLQSGGRTISNINVYGNQAFQFPIGLPFDTSYTVNGSGNLVNCNTYSSTSSTVNNITISCYPKPNTCVTNNDQTYFTLYTGSYRATGPYAIYSIVAARGINIEGKRLATYDRFGSACLPPDLLFPFLSLSSSNCGFRSHDDQISSAEWCIPPGVRYRLYEHPHFRGKCLDLVGTGRPSQHTNFDYIGFNDIISSSQWITPFYSQNCTELY